MPLPLREYYPLERAAELLECTVDDLFHWAESGKINLCVLLKKTTGYISIYDWRQEYEQVAEKINLPAIDKTTSKYEQLLFSLNNLLYIDSSNVRVIDKCREISGEYLFSNIELVQDGCVGTEEEVFWYIEPSCGIGSSYEYIRALSKTESDYIRVEVTLSGLFFLPMDTNFYRHAFLGCNSFIYSIDGVFSVSLLLDNRICINDVGFFILKSDFLKIKNASKNGDEIAIDNYLYHQRKNSERSNKSVAPRVSTPAKTAIKALIANHHPEIKGNPAKVAEVLAVEARQAGLGDVNFDKNTISNWLKES